MSEIEKEVVFKTVERIKSSLNRRFEKDANLYISKQETQKIKTLLINMNLKAITGIFITKRHSPEVLTRTILKNAWLMSSLNDKKLNELNPIVMGCKSEVFLEIMEEVISYKIDVSFEFKKFLETIYYRRISVDKCEECLENGHKDPIILKICFERVMKNIFNSDDFYSNITMYMNKHKCLKNNVNLMHFSHLEDNEKRRLIKKILSNEFLSEDRPEQVWINAINECGEIAFYEAISYLKTLNKGWEQKNQIKHVINHIIINLLNRYKDHKEEFVEKIVDVYRTLSKCAKTSMVFGCVEKIKNRELAEEIIEKFQNIGIPKGKAEEKARNFLDGNSNDTKVIWTIEDIYKECQELPWNEKKHPGHLGYIIKKLRDNTQHKELIRELVILYGKDIFVQDFVQEFLKRLYTKDSVDLLNKIIDDMTKQTEDNPDAIRIILEIIEDKISEKQYFKSESFKQFVHKYDFELYKKLYGRI